MGITTMNVNSHGGDGGNGGARMSTAGGNAGDGSNGGGGGGGGGAVGRIRMRATGAGVMINPMATVSPMSM
jgi:hypothetical protein